MQVIGRMIKNWFKKNAIYKLANMGRPRVYSASIETSKYPILIYSSRWLSCLCCGYSYETIDEYDSDESEIIHESSSD